MKFVSGRGKIALWKEPFFAGSFRSNGSKILILEKWDMRMCSVIFFCLRITTNIGPGRIVFQRDSQFSKSGKSENLLINLPLRRWRLFLLI
jgi:hypothetical protein